MGRLATEGPLFLQEGMSKMEFLSEINYDKLIEKSLKNVIIEALRIAEDQGLPGENHFYITFRTDYPGVQISKQLSSQYPEEMTIVIQHQYSNLIVKQAFFSIDLSFGGILQTLVIPYEAISYFADPHAKFGLSFHVNDDFRKRQDAAEEIDYEEEEAPKQAASGPATVVSIDAFRKKR